MSLPGDGPVVLGAVPDLPAHVWAEAARYAALFDRPLVVAHVDVTQFVAASDPDGVSHSAPGAPVARAAGLDAVHRAAATALDGAEIAWSVRALIGDPATALKDLADEVDAAVIVVGTRRRGLGETLREFFTGSVAARLAHRQHRSVLVVPSQTPIPAGDPWVE
ncbi:universal stress protein [Microbacterium sp. NPDC089189]|uniref:universal stress protein n=1 Tax=Microbacterium sp. NPDC089189 TaxID=3154972 RepID=UPI00344981DE